MVALAVDESCYRPSTYHTKRPHITLGTDIRLPTAHLRRQGVGCPAIPRLRSLWIPLAQTNMSLPNQQTDAIRKKKFPRKEAWTYLSCEAPVAHHHPLPLRLS